MNVFTYFWAYGYINHLSILLRFPTLIFKSFFSPQSASTKPLARGPSISMQSRPPPPPAASSFSQPGTSAFGTSMGMSSASYGMSSGLASLSSGNTGMTGLKPVNTGMSGASTRMSGLSNINQSMSGSFMMNTSGPIVSWNASPGPSLGSSSSRSAGGSSALDSLFAPELEHLQNKNKPSLHAMQSHGPNPTGQQLGVMGGMCFNSSGRKGIVKSLLYHALPGKEQIVHYSSSVFFFC